MTVIFIKQFSASVIICLSSFEMYVKYFMEIKQLVKLVHQKTLVINKIQPKTSILKYQEKTTLIFALKIAVVLKLTFLPLQETK